MELWLVEENDLFSGFGSFLLKAGPFPSRLSTGEKELCAGPRQGFQQEVEFQFLARPSSYARRYPGHLEDDRGPDCRALLYGDCGVYYGTGALINTTLNHVHFP